MIIVKYGDLKKKQKKTRWNAKCDECGCKVIVEKEDTEKFRQEIDYEGCPYTEFTWVCPFCHETQVYDEYDSKLDQVKETLSDWHDSFEDWAGNTTDNLMDHPIVFIFILITLIASLLAIPAGIYIRYENTHNNYKIKWVDDDGDSRTSWTNEYEIDGNIMIFIDEDERIRKVQADEANVIVLKEEE